MKQIKVSVHFELAQIVYLRTNAAFCGIVTGIMLRPSGIAYHVTWQDAGERIHYSVELSAEKVPDYVEP